MKFIESIKEVIYKKTLYDPVEIECGTFILRSYGDSSGYGITQGVEELLEFINKENEIYGYCPLCKKENTIKISKNEIPEKEYKEIYRPLYIFSNDEKPDPYK